jgi:hypothetical protein
MLITTSCEPVIKPVVIGAQTVEQVIINWNLMSLSGRTNGS